MIVSVLNYRAVGQLQTGTGITMFRPVVRMGAPETNSVVAGRRSALSK